MVMDGNGEWLSGLMNVGELFCRLKGLYSTYYIYIYCFQIQKQNGSLEPLLLLGCKSKHKHVCCRCLGFMKI